MRLADLIQQEQDGLARDRILFLRHATYEVEHLESCGAALQEYTAVQPIGGRFDFRPAGKPAIEVVVAIVRDRVHAVYRVTGVLAEGVATDICSPEYRTFERTRRESKGLPPRTTPCRKYSLAALQSGATGTEVTGWSGKEIMPVQRADGSFFELLVVNAEPLPRSAWGDNTTDVEWQEGTLRLRSHLVKERASGLASAKKRAFIDQHGRLFCERCGTDPVQAYGTSAAESCIEVHHASTAVAEMGPGHRTTLGELQCLCANCHRLTHREIRDASP